MEFNTAHLLVMVLFLVVPAACTIGILYLAYRLGQKAGDQAGYIRGYKEGQQTK
jgi:hypothetical protein